MPRFLPPLLLLLAVGAGGYGIWTLLDSGEEETVPEDGAGVRIEFEAGDADTPIRAADTDARGPATPVPTNRGLPRVLPPDAAVEDVRDALALAEDERATALADARAAISRLALQGNEVLAGLRSYAASVEDPVVRGVVTSAFGSLRDGRNVRALCATLSSSASEEERIGALIALADPAKDEGGASPAAPAMATSDKLGGMPYHHVALPTSMPVLKAGARFLDTTSTTSAEDALPVLLRSVASSPEWAALLVEDEERMCTWYRALSEESRRRVRSAALEHERLPRGARRKIEAAD